MAALSEEKQRELLRQLNRNSLRSIPMFGPFLTPEVVDAFGRDVQRIGQSLGNAVMAPANALAGKYDQVEVNEETGAVTPFDQRMADDAANMAGWIGTGSLPMPKPSNSLGMFGGRMAKTADHEALARAERMDAAGEQPEAIWSETGWFKGADGKWRFEIDDSGSTYKGRAAGPATGDLTIGDVIDHPELFRAYPEAKRIKADIDEKGEFGGYFDSELNTIGIGEILADRARRTSMHELQHYTQSQEGFARGGNPTDASLGPLAQSVRQKADSIYGEATQRRYDWENEFFRREGIDIDSLRGREHFNAMQRAQKAYQEQFPAEHRLEQASYSAAYGSAGPAMGYERLAGEVEARNTALRTDFSPEQRNRTAPWASQDIPNELQIVRGATLRQSGVPFVAQQQEGQQQVAQQLVRMPDGVVVAFPDDMPREEIRALIEEKFPDAAQSRASGPSVYDNPEVKRLTGTTAQGDYNRSLRHIRETQFPNMSDGQWAEYSQKFLGPYSNTELSQHGALFGLTDEISSGIGALGSQARRWMGDQNSPDFGTAFNDYEQLEQSRRDKGREQAGLSGAVAEGLGGIAAMAPAASAAAAAPSLAGQMLKGGASGATLGALYGAGSADENRLGEGAVSGLVGGALGAAVPVVARGVSGAYNSLRGAMQARGAANHLGVEPGTARYLQETLAADDALSPAGQARVAAAGNEGMVADAGQSARNALDHAVQSSGRAGRVATEEIGGRVTRDAAAINDALDNALGAPQGVQNTRTNIRQGSAQARGNAYDRAYTAPIDYSSPEGIRVEQLLGRLKQSDIEAANEMMRMEGHQSRQIMAQITPDGRVTFRRMPDVRQIDYITRALNDVADSNVGKGALGGLANKGRVYGNLAREIRDNLRQAVPEYGHALDTAADPIRRSQAVQNGADWLRVSRDQVEEWAQGFTAAERDAFLQGIRSNIDDTLARVSRAVADGDMDAREAIKALKVLSSRDARDKLRVAIGDQRRADALLDELDRAAHSFELRADVAGNSKTFQRQEMNRRADALTDPDGIVGTAAKGKPVNAVQRGIQTLTGTTPQHALQRKDAMLEEAARFLTRRGPAAQNSLAAMGNYNAATARRSQASMTLRQFLESGGAIAADQLTRHRKSWLPL